MELTAAAEVAGETFTPFFLATAYVQRAKKNAHFNSKIQSRSPPSNSELHCHPAKSDSQNTLCFMMHNACAGCCLQLEGAGRLRQAAAVAPV